MKKLKDYEYFKTDLGVLYHGKCEIILPLIYEEIENGNIDKIDLVLTDPPYGIKQMTYKRNKSRGSLAKSKDYKDNLEWDNKIPDKIVFDYLRLISKNQIIFGGNYFIEYLQNSSCWLVWDKNNGKNDFSDCELAWTNFNTAVRKYKYTWNGMIQENMKNKEKRVHPTQKPLMLFNKILKDYSKKHDLILDSYSGSGTTAVNCEKINRRWIVIEEKEKYCNMSVPRIKMGCSMPEMDI